MVAFLKKPSESDGFTEAVDFLRDSAYTISIHSQCFSIVNLYLYKLAITLSRLQRTVQYKALRNELVNDDIKLSKLELNTGFINGLPKKWLSFCQSLRNTNHMKDFELASLFSKLKYEENLIDSICETEKKKSLISTTSLSTAFFSTYIVQDFQNSLDDEEDTRSSQEYMDDLEEEYQ
ncbi:hypothetical protein Tco_1469200, partial [Tanacetum coccineum]